MMIFGRICKDAIVHQLNDERRVVNFTVAVNDYYKPKGKESVKLTTYYNCAYWKNTKVADRLKKGALVEVGGRIFVTAYTGKDLTPKASFNCHVNTLKIHSFSKEGTTTLPTAKPEEVEETPF